MRRYDYYGFRQASLDDAAKLVQELLGIRLNQRDSSYWGLYYNTPGDGYLLYVNDRELRWEPRYAEYGVILSVNDLPDMDTIKDRLTTGRTEPVLLRSNIHTKDPPEEYLPDSDTDDDDT